jgi:hypothetical protein
MATVAIITGSSIETDRIIIGCGKKEKKKCS